MKDMNDENMRYQKLVDDFRKKYKYSTKMEGERRRIMSDKGKLLDEMVTKEKATVRTS